MPWTAINRLYRIVTVQAFIIALMLIGFGFICRVTPYEVYKKLMSVETQIRVVNKSVKTNNEITAKDVKKLQEDMKQSKQMLLKANEQLKKLDPTYEYSTTPENPSPPQP